MDNLFKNMQKLAFGKSNINESSITKSALKQKIREMVLDEAKKKKKDTPEDVAPQEDTNMDIEASIEDTDAITPEVSTEVDIDPKVKAIQDSLNKALANAKALGDEKLVNQIGNTITMLVRTQVVGQQAIAENNK
jgi:hypothetical protein